MVRSKREFDSLLGLTNWTLYHWSLPYMKNEAENYGEPKIVKKIKVIPAEGFWGGFDDSDYDQEMLAEAEERAEKEPEEPLSYNPFDPEAELKKLRKLSPREQILIPSEEKRRIRKERLISFKEKLMRQKEGIARTIDDLRTTIESAPGTTAEVLLSKVQAAAQEYKFTRAQNALFKYAIEKYQEKHAAVEKYRTMYPSDANLFEACFGKKPKGEVVIVKSPMTLFFRCFDRDDYAFLFGFFKHRGDKTKIEPGDVNRANDTAGVAISYVKIEELAGTITAENVGNNSPRYEMIKGAEKTEEIHKEESRFFIDSQKGDIEIEIKNIGVWKIRFVERDDEGNPARIQFINLNKHDTPPIFDVVRVKPDEEMDAHGNFLGLLKGVGDGRLQYNIIRYLKVGSRIYGSINIDRAFIRIQDDSPDGTSVKYREDGFIMVPNEEMSDTTRIHEDQHQFNKLFTAFEARERILSMMGRVVESANTPEEAVEKLIHGVVRLERQWMGFDSAARDEILAYYKEGESVDGIFKQLTTSKAYDYAKLFKYQIAKIPVRAKEQLRKEVGAVFYQQFKDGESTVIDVSELEIEESDVQPHIESVFGSEYKVDLQTWLASISVLEKKGYARGEIVALLYQEPVNSWSNLARRMKPKVK